MQMQRHVVLNYLDTPLKILFWTVPEILMLIVPIFIGLIIEQLILGLTISILSFWLNKKYNQHFGKGRFQVVKYWFLPPESKFRTLPKSFVREYLG